MDTAMDLGGGDRVPGGGRGPCPTSCKSASRQKTAAAIPPSNKLDTVDIRKKYLDGDFDLAIESIEDALKYGGPFSHQDSVFILKHLGVMHSAKYETREKGKRYFMELLAVEPTAKILDMYASDMIYMIFKNIRDEFETRHPGKFTNPGKRPEPEPVTGDPKPDSKKSRAWMGWTTGALAGGALVTLYLLNQEPAPKTAEYTSND